MTAKEGGNVMARKEKMMRGTFRPRGLDTFSLLLVIVMIVGCAAPKVVEFKVRPNHVCGGDRVNIFWTTAGGTTTLSSNPDVDPPLGEVANEGSDDRDVDQTTTFTVTVTRGGNSDNDDETVEVVPPGGADFRFGTTGECVDGTPKWAVVIPPNEWSDRLTVNTVRNTSGVAIDVTHGNVVVSLGPNGETSIFEGPVSGDWFLRRVVSALDNPCPIPDGHGGTIEPGPRPDGSPRPPLGSLSISINAVCQ